MMAGVSLEVGLDIMGLVKNLFFFVLPVSLELSGIFAVEQKHLLVTACVVGGDRFISNFWFVISINQETFNERAKQLISRKLESIGLESELKYHQDYEAHCSSSAPSDSCPTFKSSLTGNDLALVNLFNLYL